MLCAHVTLQRQRLLLCHLGDTPHQSTCSIFLGETAVFSSSLWITGTPYFPSHPFKFTDAMFPLYTTVPALLLLALHVSLLGQRQPWQTGSLLSSTRCFPETSLSFLSVFLLALYKNILYLQETSSNPPAFM